MGLHGPLRNPNSRRGQAEIRKRQRIAAASGGSTSGSVDGHSLAVGVAQELPTCDKCLPRRVQEEYLNLVVDLAAASVPIMQVDSRAITMAARCLVAVEEAEKIAADGDSTPAIRLSALKLSIQCGKDLQRWLEIIGATPTVRARIKLKPPPEKKPADEWDNL